MTRHLRNLALASGLAAALAGGSLALAAERAPLDANGDGAIDFAELQARRSDITAEQFSAMDKDGNGSLSREEMRTAGRERMQARAEERFKALDTDGDGGLSREELAARREQAAEERFSRLDANGDGRLTQSEMQAARETMRERRGQRGPGRGGPGRGQGGN